MKHDHDHFVEVKLSPELQETVDQTKSALQNFQNNPKAMLVVGVVIGVVGSRIFARPPMQQLIVVSGDAAIVE